MVPVFCSFTLLLGGCDRSETQAITAAKSRIAKNEDAAAEIELKNLLQKHPKSGEARYLLGLQGLKRGDGATALIELQRAADLNYAAALVAPATAQALMMQNKGRQVIDEFGKTQLADTNANAELQALVAQAMAAEGNADGALALIDRAVASAPTSEPVLMTQAGLHSQAGRREQALASLDRLIAAKPDSHLAWGMKGTLLGMVPDQYAQAMAALRKAVSIKPGDVPAQTGLVALALHRGEMDAAGKELDALRKIAPNQLNTRFFEANVAYANGNYSEAQSSYQTVLKALPLHPEVLLSAAETELKLGATAQAETMAAKALTQAPGSLRARHVLAQVYLRMGQPAKAIANLARVIDGPGVTPELLALAAQAQLISGNAKAADQLYDRMAKLQPTDPRLRTLIASSGFGRVSDDTVFTQLQQIAKDETDSSADLAIIAAHLSRQQFDPALKAVADLEGKRPGDPLPHFLRGQILVKKSDLAGARSHFEKAVSLDKGYFPATAALTVLDLGEQKADAAEQRLKNYLVVQPNDAKAMLAIAELMERRQQPRAAVLNQIEAAVKAAPTDQAARVALISHRLAQGQTEAALTAAQAANAALPDNTDLLDLLGQCLLRDNQAQQALNSYGKIITLDPKSPRGHVGMADVYLHTRDLDQAQRSATRALEVSPGLVKAKALLFTVSMQRLKFDQAAATARSMQADHPQDGTGLLLEAEAEMGRSNWAIAATLLRKALDKSVPELAAIKLFTVLKRDGKGDEADSFGQQWLKRRPGDTYFQLTVADEARVSNKFGVAEQHYRQLLMLHPNYLPALNNLAMTLILGKKPGAIALAEQASRLAPDSPEVLDTLAQALASENRLRDAVETQKRALAIAPKLADLRLTYAGLLIKSGDKQQARAELETLARLGSGFARQSEVLGLRQTLQ